MQGYLLGAQQGISPIPGIFLFLSVSLSLSPSLFLCVSSSLPLSLSSVSPSPAQGKKEELRKLENEVKQSYIIRFCKPVMQKTASELWLNDQRRTIHLECTRFLQKDARRCNHCQSRDFVPFHHYVVDIYLDTGNIESMAKNHDSQSNPRVQPWGLSSLMPQGPICSTEGCKITARIPPPGLPPALSPGGASLIWAWESWGLGQLKHPPIGIKRQLCMFLDTCDKIPPNPSCDLLFIHVG